MITVDQRFTMNVQHVLGRCVMYEMIELTSLWFGYNDALDS